MSDRVAVAKMHGARNDFVVIDARSREFANYPELGRRICNRHVGIGADGVLFIERSELADVRMRVINPDGSEAEMCGNGIRCVARYMDEAQQRAELAIDTLGGVIHTSIVERGEIYRVRAEMGLPRLLETRAPFPSSFVVDTGNPHVVVFLDEDAPFDLRAEGEALQHHPAFAEGVNLHAARVMNEGELKVEHYERGAGLTMACGTGAVASAYAAWTRGSVAMPVDVHVPGGTLRIEIADDGFATMTGPVVRVFDGMLDLDALGAG